MRTCYLIAITVAIAYAAVAPACQSQNGAQRDLSAPSAVSSAQAQAAPMPAVPSTDFRNQFVEVARSVGPAVVSITAVATMSAPERNPFEGSPFEFFFHGLPHPGSKQKRTGVGSGVIVDSRGYILTNNHVVEDADELTVILQDERELSAKLVGADPKTDIAVIKVESGDLPAIGFGDSDRLQVGEWVMAVGSPFGLKQTVSAGIVSAVGRGNMGIADYEDFIQTDAAINPGNSGGPLCDLSGRLVGINTAIASRSGGSVGVGFAIPSNMAKAVMDQLIDHGQVVRGYLGIFIADLSEDLAKSFGYTGSDGILIQDVEPGGPAFKAGLAAGDIVVKRDGKAVDDMATFRNGIAQTPPGTKVALQIFRDGKLQAVTVTLAELPADAKAERPSKSGQAAPFGLGLTDVTPQLRERFELSSDAGALVSEVQPDSPAASAGLRPGDLIKHIGNTAVKGAAHAKKLFAKADPKKPLRVRVERKGRGMFLLIPPRKSP